MAMYYITVKAPLTVPLYLYVAEANGTVSGALTISYRLFSHHNVTSMNQSLALHIDYIVTSVI